MPNWVTQKVRILGHATDIDLVKRCFFTEHDSDNYGLDFNKVIPMPPSMHITSGSIVDNAISVIKAAEKGLEIRQSNIRNAASLVYKMGDDVPDDIKSLRDDIAFMQGKLRESYANTHLPDRSDEQKDADEKVREALQRDIRKSIDAVNELVGQMQAKDVMRSMDNNSKHILEGQLAIDNMKIYGFKDWYDWSVANWGTKWGSQNLHVDDSDPNTLVLRLDTAWSPALPIFQAIVEQSKDLVIEGEFVDEGWCFAGGFHVDEDGLSDFDVDCSADSKAFRDLYERVYDADFPSEEEDEEAA